MARNINFDPYDIGLIDRVESILRAQALLPAMATQNLPGGDEMPLLMRRTLLVWRLQQALGDPTTREAVSRAIAHQELDHIGHLVEAERLCDDSFVDASRLEVEGITRFNELLTPPEVASVVDHFANKAPAHVSGDLFYAHTLDVLAAPHLLRIALSPRILGAAMQYLGAPVTLYNFQFWKSSPSSAPPDVAHMFHRDRIDFRACIFYMYLSEVDSKSGPHRLVPGSHLRQRLNTKFEGGATTGVDVQKLFRADASYAEQEIGCLFGDDILEIVGPAGSGFMTDPFAIHRGKEPEARSRLIFQALYGLTPYPKWASRPWYDGAHSVPSGVQDTPLVRHAFRFFSPASAS